MKDKVTQDPASSIRARLLAHAKTDGHDLQRVLTRYAVERFLFRLSQTEAVERYVLKGAMLFVMPQLQRNVASGRAFFVGRP